MSILNDVTFLALCEKTNHCYQRTYIEVLFKYNSLVCATTDLFAGRSLMERNIELCLSISFLIFFFLSDTGKFLSSSLV